MGTECRLTGLFKGMLRRLNEVVFEHMLVAADQRSSAVEVWKEMKSICDDMLNGDLRQLL